MDEGSTVRMGKDQVFFKSEGTSLHCRFHGKLDSDTCVPTSTMVFYHLTTHEPTEVVFDLSKVDYCSSAFLRLCMQVAKQVNYKFRILGSPAKIKELFDMAGLVRRLNVL